MPRGFPRLPGIAAQSAIGSAKPTGLPGDRRGLERENVAAASQGQRSGRAPGKPRPDRLANGSYDC